MDARRELTPAVTRGGEPSVKWWLIFPVLTRETTGSLLAAVITAYVVTLVLLSPLPLQDFPTHLARAVAISDFMFHHGQRFESFYQYHFLLVPYVLGDLMLACAVEVFGPRQASALWISFVLLSLPFAVLFYARATAIAINRRALLVLLSLYLATDWSFTMGFLNFRVSVAMILATMALADMLRTRWRTALYVTYAGAVLLDYLMHLSSAAFLCAGLGTSALLRLHLRTTRLRTEVLLMAPVAAVLLWNFAVADGYRAPTDLVENPYIWGTVRDKLARLGSEFFRYHWRSDALLAVAFVACLSLQMGRMTREGLRSPRLLEFLTLAITFLGMYFALPLAYSDAIYVDVRALPMATLFAVFACVRAGEEGSTGGTLRMGHAMSVATILALANLGTLSRDWLRNNAYVTEYRAMVAAAPWHARIFPVYTRGHQGSVEPLLHLDSYITIDRSGLMPYEFTGDNGNTVRYFRYLHRPYDPDEQWYKQESALQIHWSAIACDYDYLIVTKPFSPERLPLRMTMIASNDAAALFTIDKQECAPALTSSGVSAVPK